MTKNRTNRRIRIVERREVKIHGNLCRNEAFREEFHDSCKYVSNAENARSASGYFSVL